MLKLYIKVVTIIVATLIAAPAGYLGVQALLGHKKQDKEITAVHIDDRAGILNDEKITKELSTIHTYTDVEAAILTDTNPQGKHLQEVAKTWDETTTGIKVLDRIDPGAMKTPEWKNNIFYIVLTTDSKAKVFYGTDVQKTMTKTQSISVEQSAASSVANHEWDTAVERMSHKAAEHMGKESANKNQAVVPMLVMGTAFFIIRILYQTFTVSRSASKLDTEITQLRTAVEKARSIPRTGAGEAIHRIADDAENKVRTAERKREEVASGGFFDILNARGWKDLNVSAWWINGAERALSNAHTLYTRDTGWEKVWKEEIAELEGDLRKGLKLWGNKEASAKVSSYSKHGISTLQRISYDFTTQGNTDDCLLALLEIRTALSQKVKELAETYTQSDEVRTKAEHYREKHARGTRTITGFILSESYYPPQAYTDLVNDEEWD